MFNSNLKNNDSDFIDFEFFEDEGNQIKECITLSQNCVSEPFLSSDEDVNRSSKPSNKSTKSLEPEKDIKPKTVQRSNNLGLQTNRSSSDPTENSSHELSFTCLVKKNDACKKEDSGLYFRDDEFSESSISDGKRTNMSSDLSSSSLLNSTSDSSLASNISMNSSTFKTLSDDSSNSNDTTENNHYYLDKNESNEFNSNRSKDIKNQDKDSVNYKSYTEIDTTLCRTNKSNQNNKTTKLSNKHLAAEFSVSNVEGKLKKMLISPQSSSTRDNLASSKFSKLIVRRKQNLTFNRQEMIKIERDNSILLKKIINLSKPVKVVLNQSFSHKKTSAAINRAKQQKKIDQENDILCRRLNEMSRTKSVC